MRTVSPVSMNKRLLFILGLEGFFFALVKAVGKNLIHDPLSVPCGHFADLIVECNLIGRRKGFVNLPLAAQGIILCAVAVTVAFVFITKIVP
ncbi:hypothetical protein SDC9_115523 [bioreactor metagenome]|uniref:Uncharacterized protein n=1 Tax=bioreactor metagenome TaxID=1076179 RepID=A0A645BT36_9ZZZZ